MKIYYDWYTQKCMTDLNKSDNPEHCSELIRGVDQWSYVEQYQNADGERLDICYTKMQIELGMDLNRVRMGLARQHKFSNLCVENMFGCVIPSHEYDKIAKKLEASNG